MLKQLEVFLVAAVFIFMSAIVLIIYSKQREQEFKAHSILIQKSAVDGAAYAINQQLVNKQRHVRLFADEYANLLSHLNTFPQDTKTEEDIKTRLNQRFTDFFTYTITDQNAVPKLFDIESLVGEACQRDLSSFVKSIQYKTNKDIFHNKIFIHPQSLHYHYDVMAPLYKTEGKADIFFISFYLKDISNILKTHETPGNQLILVKQSETDLIEVTSKGARDKISRGTRLNKDEQIQIVVYKNIPGTDWRLVNLADINYEKQYKKGLWKEAGIILLIEIISIFLLMFVLLRLRNK